MQDMKIMSKCFENSLQILSIGSLIMGWPYISQPTFQRRINVVSTLWINVEITLIRRWKWNKIQRRIFNVHNVDTTSVLDVETTLHNVETTLHNVGTTLIQRCFNLASTLVKTILNPVWLVMIMDLQIHE